MNAPEPLPQADSGPEQQSLWSQAPAWRNLAVGAAILTAAAVALPLALPNGPKAPASPAPVTATHPPSAPPAAPPAPTVLQQDASKTAAAPPPKVVYVEKYITAPSPRPVAPPAPAPAPAQAPAAPANELAVQTQAVPSPDTQACTLRVPVLPANTGAGIVVGFENRATSLARIPLTQQQLGGRIDPDYVDNLRVVVHLDSGTNQSVVVPREMAVRLGDRVTVQSVHRNTALPCSYFPPLVTADLGQVAKAALGAAPGSAAGGP